MRIAVIGSGNIGGSLGAAWRRDGHDVVFGSRHPEGDGPAGAAVTTVEESVQGADVVVLAVPGGAVEGVLEAVGPALTGIVVVDASNRPGSDRMDAHGLVAAHAPGARYVRAFNSLGWENFADPVEGTDLFFAADPEAVPVAEQLISAVGLRPVLIGDASAAPVLDGVTRLWFALTARTGTRRIAFRTVR